MTKTTKGAAMPPPAQLKSACDLANTLKDLEGRLEELRLDFENAGGSQDVVAAWDAIERITRLNADREKHGARPIPIPSWLNKYLLQSANNIFRLWLGIDPKDSRSIPEIGVDNVGKLRGLPGERDRRTEHVAEALGFTRKGASVFRMHDNNKRNNDYIQIIDDRSVKEIPELRKEIIRMIKNQIMQQEGGGEAAATNKISAARSYLRRRAGKKLTKPSGGFNE